jgi:hypothetical protein
MNNILGRRFLNRMKYGWDDAITLAFNLATASSRKRKQDDSKFLKSH